MQVRSSLWDLEGRIFGWFDSRYPRYRWFQDHLFRRHRAYVMLLFGDEEPNGFTYTRPSLTTGETIPWFVAVCVGCRWESVHRDMDVALAAARKHSPRVRPDVLSAVDLDEATISR